MSNYIKQIPNNRKIQIEIYQTKLNAQKALHMGNADVIFLKRIHQYGLMFACPGFGLSGNADGACSGWAGRRNFCSSRKRYEYYKHIGNIFRTLHATLAGFVVSRASMKHEYLYTETYSTFVAVQFSVQLSEVNSCILSSYALYLLIKFRFSTSVSILSSKMHSIRYDSVSAN